MSLETIAVTQMDVIRVAPGGQIHICGRSGARCLPGSYVLSTKKANEAQPEQEKNLVWGEKIV